MPLVDVKRCPLSLVIVYCCLCSFVVCMLLFVVCCVLFVVSRLLIDVVSLLCGVVRCLLCVVVALLLFVVNGFVGVCCSLSYCRCVMCVCLRRLMLDLGVCGVLWLFFVRVCSVLRVVCCLLFANCC